MYPSMFPEACTNCQSDQISGPHKVFAGADQPWIFVENMNHRWRNKAVKMRSYICLNCGEIKLLADKADVEKLAANMQEQVAD